VDSESLYEIVNGQRRQKPPMGTLAAAIASFLVHYLNAFALPNKHGFAVSEVLFNLRPQHPQRRPDIAFVSYGRWQTPPARTQDPPAWDVVPDLAVEVVRPTNTAVEIEDKIQEYFDAGVELVWVIYPIHRRIYVYESPTQTRILLEKDELDGGKVLPGFRLPMATLFAHLVKPN
jgi:Uma2 family endonuclease